jgi:predicted RNA-binding protein
MPKYYVITTSPENFEIDKRTSGFTVQGLKEKHKKTVQKWEPGDRVVYYINKIGKFGGIAEVVSGYYRDDTKIWAEKDELWPSRAKTKPIIVLEKEDFLDVRRYIDKLSFIKDRFSPEFWGLAFQGSVREISEEDYQYIESEMRKVTSIVKLKAKKEPEASKLIKDEDFEIAIMELPLETKSLHDRIGEMLSSIGSWMRYNTFVRYRITPEHNQELDVAWLRDKNPAVAIEIQISGSIPSAIANLTQAKKFNYRKLIIVIKNSQLKELNERIKFDEIRYWLDAWSIKSIYEMYQSGESFFRLYEKVEESRFRDRKGLELI